MSLEVDVSKFDLSEIKRPQMHENEFPLFVKSIIAAQEKGGAFVEVGVNKAKSTACIYQVLSMLKANRNVYSVDATEEAHKWWKDRQRFNDTCATKFILGKSQSKETVASVLHEIGWLYIDACHCYDCVCGDIEAWALKVMRYGYIVFHDTSIASNKNKATYCINSGKKRLWGVKKAILESEIMSKKYELVESVERKPSGGKVPGIRVYRRVS